MTNPIPSDSANRSKIFKCADHADNISKKLQTFYKRKEFFDIDVIAGVDNVRIQAHRFVLSASSDYFMGMFRSTLQDARADEVELKEVDGGTMKLVIDFMYTGSIELNCETVENVLRTADFLQMNTLIFACCDFMCEGLDAGNCLGIALFAEQYNYTALHEEASSFAWKNFDKVCTGEEFFHLDEEQLSKFLSSDDLFTHSEENVFLSLVAWLKYDKENREKFICNLLSNVRFTFLKPEFIIENRLSVCKTVECYELICSWLQWHLSPGSRSKFPSVHTKARKSSTKLAFVGWRSTNDLKLKTLNRELNTWSYEDLPIPLKEKSQCSAIVINKKLIVAGGVVGGNITNTVECLDLETKKWTDLPPMRVVRRYFAMIDLNGELYAVGGETNNGWTNSVEKYNFSTKEWQNVVPMNSQFTYVKVAVDDGHLYATGYNSHIIECYDIAANKWTHLTNRNTQLVNPGIAVVGGHLYTVGGSSNGIRSNAVEMFNLSTKTWAFANALGVGRSSVRCIALNNRLIACGGHNGTAYVGLIEEYDPNTNKWSTLASLTPDEADFYSHFSSVFTM